MSPRIRAPHVLVAASLALLGACATESSSTMDEGLHPVHASAMKAEPMEFSLQGHYVEACSCSAPCPCELTGPDMSCKGVAAYQFDKGHYGTEDFSGCRMAFGLYIGEVVQLYIDAPTPEKRAAMEHFARAALAGFGPMKGVRDAKIEISGKDGAYSVMVDGGKVMTFKTEPMLGGDKKTPVVHSNTFDVINPVMYQGQCSSCTFTQGDMKIELKGGSNSYFNAHMMTSGKI